MNTTIIKGSWKEMTGKAKQKIAGVTGSKLLYFSGKQDEWMGKAQKQYGKLKDAFAR